MKVPNSFHNHGSLAIFELIFTLKLLSGASGCLVFALVDNDMKDNLKRESREVTKALIESLQSDDANKTYIALCDGNGEWNGKNFLEKGWFTIDRPVKDENGNFVDATTDLCFVAGMTLPPVKIDNTEVSEGRHVSLVLARPKTGKYHQIRQHLASGRIGHAILGDSSHGRSRTNRIWKKRRHLMKERTCLHLVRLELPPTDFTPNGIQCTCPLSEDLKIMFDEMPELMEMAKPKLLIEGVTI